MSWKGANRLYSRQSLELWSSRLGGDWEAAFSEAELRRGRSIYKRGEIREISLNDSDVIVNSKIGVAESYSVVEWSSGKISVRSSTSDEVLGGAIAVAGLLEIEELLADEELSLIESEGLGLDGEREEEKEEEAPIDLSKNAMSKEGEARVLHLVLDTHFKGLICEAYWLGGDGTRVSALSKEDGAPRANNSEERGRLIMLAARARKSHFVYSPEFGGYLLENLREVVFFIQSVWPSWKARFSTEERENVKHIQQGIVEIKLKPQASRAKSGGLDIQWVFDAGAKLLDSGLADELLARNEEPMLVPELGVIKLTEESRQALSAWKEVEAEASGAGQLYQLFSLFGEGEEEVELSDELSQWREGLLNPKPDAELELLDCLRPYQRQGVEWMSRLLRHDCHCLLADEMGLGKTVQVIALLLAQRQEGERVIVVCPASVVPVWISEFAKFAPDVKVGKYGGRTAKAASKLDVVVVSFALLRNRIERLVAEEFDYAVVDEAQFIKNPDSKVSRSCRRLRAKRRIALTGTPIENKPLDIWPAFQFLMPGMLGSREQFDRLYAENPGAFKARLRAQIKPFMLRRTKSEVALELPEKTIVDLECPVTPVQAREYQRICEEGLARFGDDLGSAMRTNRFATLSLLTRLRQVSCDPQLLPWMEASIEDSGKLMVLLEKLIEVLGTGHKVVIFSQFVRFLVRAREMIEHAFPELPIFELTGSTADREAPVREFQGTDQTAAMLVSLKAASVGITLHAADYVFLLDPWWNPAVESQAIDRVHRIGQTKSVFVYRLFAQGTIEEKIQLLQKEKRDLFDSIVSGSKSGPDLLASGVQSLQSLLALAQSG
ncbi:DEAD/DEAH box helicase [Pelagicoccus sp. SDUM812005]|uniref:DEAD/DEAH box helicase n=1 Tax=Pelagicoccus sp. SDUM812005 TaxID=3041257 RepID=UPI00280F00E2|nr:DEAD/DEAH box helicase [Pelagicoccus sp. SDUM812005]MDQ8179856.1 DEAD/DEAH box helicase [Pelagicoccus sp. SDUM812005]